MLLVIEVGNTNTGVGVYDGQRLLVSWRLTSRREQTADEYGVFIQTLLRTRGIEPQHVTGVAISNVVPPVQRTLEWMSDAYFGIHPFTVQPGVNVDQRSFPPELTGQATSLRLVTGRAHDSARVEAAVLTALHVRYDAWLSGGFDALRDAWRSRSSTIGTRVGLPDGGDGMAVDVDGDGALLVDVGGGTLTRVVAAIR